jgi:hypothetical protein
LHHHELFDFSPGVENFFHRGFGPSDLRAGERQMACRPCRQSVVILREFSP